MFYNQLVKSKLAIARKYFQPALTQQGLADLLQVDRSTIARWERTNSIPPEAIAKVSHLSGIPESWFQLDTAEEPILNAAPSNGVTIPNSPMATGVAREALLSVWRGVLASEGECEFWETGGPEFRSVPAFLVGNEPEQFVVCIASGVSMAPRIDHAERAIVRLDPDPPLGALVVVRRPDGAVFIKALRRVVSQSDEHRLQLQSLNPAYAPISDLRGWTLLGYVIAILHTYSGGGANIEWDDGRPLRA